MTLPIVVVAGLLLGHAGSSDHSSGTSDRPLPAITVPAPPEHDAATLNDCNKVLQSVDTLTTLKALTPRVVHTVPGDAATSSFVVAWGDPAITVSCGVARPKDLRHGSTKLFVSGSKVGTAGPFYDITTSNGNEVYTTVDRAVYVAIAIPASYQGGTYLPILSTAIAKALPAVCEGGQPPAGTPSTDSKLCANRP